MSASLNEGKKQLCFRLKFRARAPGYGAILGNERLDFKG
jgi:hypothetical protein